MFRGFPTFWGATSQKLLGPLRSWCPTTKCPLSAALAFMICKLQFTVGYTFSYVHENFDKQELLYFLYGQAGNSLSMEYLYLVYILI
jgi:hypothetical protein